MREKIYDQSKMFMFVVHFADSKVINISTGKGIKKLIDKYEKQKTEILDYYISHTQIDSNTITYFKIDQNQIYPNLMTI